MGRVDAADDTIKRYVVRIYAFDDERHERRHRLIAAFDDEAEGMRCVGETHADLEARRAAGLADRREYVTMVIKEPGDDERARQRRIAERRMRGS